MLEAFATVNQRGGLHFKSMLHMDKIHFDENGFVKVQEMSHVFFDQYKLKQSDLIYLPPEALAEGKLSEKGDVWTLGITLLLCMSLEFDLEAVKETRERLLALFNRIKCTSLLQGGAKGAVANDEQVSSDSDTLAISKSRPGGGGGHPNIHAAVSYSSDEEGKSDKGMKDNWVDFYSSSNEFDFG